MKNFVRFKASHVVEKFIITCSEVLRLYGMANFVVYSLKSHYKEVTIIVD